MVFIFVFSIVKIQVLDQESLQKAIDRQVFILKASFPFLETLGISFLYIIVGSATSAKLKNKHIQEN